MSAYKYYFYSTEKVRFMQQVHKENQHYEARTAAWKFFIVKKLLRVNETTRIY